MSNGESVDFNVDTNNLYREEAFTDLKVASIRRLVPIKLDGTDDPSRDAVFVAQTQLMSPSGMIPIQANLRATTLEGAIKEFPMAMNQEMEHLIEEAQNRQREDASRIVVPGASEPGKIIS